MPDVDRPLAGGLVLRSARPGDHDAIVALEVAAFGPSDEPIVRSRLAHEPDGWIVVEDRAGSGRIVSASVLLRHRLQLRDVVLPVGQIENVATDPAFRRRRLVRAQFETHHERSAGRGDLAVLITGIPYLYRRLGYGYGLDYPAIHLPTVEQVGAPDGTVVRPAGSGDLPGIEALDATRSTEQLRVVRDRESWRRALDRSTGTRFEQLVVAERDGVVVGFAQLDARPAAQRLFLDPGMAVDEGAGRALVAHALAQGADHGELVVAFANPGTVYGDTLAALGDPVRYSHGIYVRVPDAVVLLDALRPVLSARLAASRYADRDGALTISLYESGLTIRFAAGAVTDIAVVDAIEDPFDSDDVGIPPDQLGALAFGRFDPLDLEQRVDDVTLGSHRRLVQVLFPKVDSELLADL